MVVNDSDRLLRNIGSVLRQYRKERGLTQGQLSKAAGVSVNHISSIENGTTDLGMKVFFKITESLAANPQQALSNALNISF